MARAWGAEHGLLVPLDGGTPETPPSGGGGGGGITPPPPGGTGMLVGASVSRGRPAFDAIRATAGPWSMSRTYNSGNFATAFDLDKAAPDIGHLASVFSAKPSLDLMASGAYDTLVTGWLTSIPTGHPVFPCIWHEPDVKYRSTSGLNIPLWKSATDRFLSICADVGNPHVYPQLIFTNWSLIGGVSKGFPDDFWQASWAGKVKCVGWDLYMLHNTLTTPEHELKPCRDWCDAKGLAWGIAEIGIRAAVTDHTGAAVTWTQNMFEYARTNGAGPHGSCCYFAMFDFAATAPNTPLPSGDPAWPPMSAAFSSAHYLPYTAFTL